MKTSRYARSSRIVVNGRGTIWVDDIRLLKESVK